MGFVRGVYVLFFVSGALGLVYEVLWLRKLLLVFGSTVYAVSTILTVFFGGLALGSWIFGRLIDRREASGLLWYAALEAVIGLYAFLTLPLFAVVEQVYIPLYRASNFSPAVLIGASFLCSAAVLLIPTTLMGGTFPILSRFLIRTAQERGMKIASLYGINTLGAMAGTLFVYYVALQQLGWTRTVVCAGLLNVLIGVLARSLDRNLRQVGFRVASSQPAPAATTEIDQSSRTVFWLFLAFGLSGFSAMTYEVAWTRSLSLVLGSSIYAFCIMLATFLGGMAVGSIAARLHLRQSPAKLGQFVLLEVCLAAYGLLSISLFGSLPDWFVSLWPVFSDSLVGLAGLQVILSALVMALPTFFMGLLFPIVSDLVTGRFAQLGQRLGLAYSINTLGGIVGSFLSGFWLIPQLGIAQTIVLAAVINLAAGLLIYVRFAPVGVVRRVGLAAACLALYIGLGQWLFVPSWQRQALAAGAYLEPGNYRASSVAYAVERSSELLFYRESLNATVSVHRHKQGRHLYLKVGGKTDASTGIDMGTQVLLAHIPLLLHPGAQRVLVIGLGSGVTLGSAGRYPVSVLHCAEIDPAVVEGARFFADYNYRVHDDPRARIFVADGRNFLLATPNQYDVIISEPSNPWMAGVANLFTQEFYQLAKQQLAAHGVMAQWVQLYRIFPADVKLLLKTFQEVFPYVSVWSTIPGDLLLIGSLEPQQFDYEALVRQLAQPAIKQDLDRVALGDPRVLLESFRLGPEQVRQVVSDVPWIHHDDQPWVEFNAPKALYVGETFGVNYNGIEAWKTPVQTMVSHLPQQEPDAAFYLALGGAYRYRDETKKALEAFEQAVRLDPRSSAGYTQLGELYSRQDLLFKAHEVLTRAIELDPRQLEAHQALARLFWRQDREAEALQSYARAASLKVPDAPFAEELGTVLRKAHRPREAAEYLRSALSQAEEASASLFVAVAETAKELNHLEDAAQILAVAMSRHPDVIDFPLLLADVELAQGQRAQAKRLFERVVKQAPSTAQGYFGLGQLALEAGDVSGAARWLAAGLRYDPYNVHALKTLQELHKSHAG